MENARITITDHYIKCKDGRVIRVRMHKEAILEIEEDFPIIWPQVDPVWISETTEMPAACLALMKWAPPTDARSVTDPNPVKFWSNHTQSAITTTARMTVFTGAGIGT